MSRNSLYIKILCLFSIYLYPSLSSADTDLKKTILWYKPEFPPLSIVNGLDAGNGYSDKLEKFFIQELNTYKHSVIISPFKRTLKDMKKGLNVCSVTLLKNPEREKFIAFTKPARLLLPNELIVRKKDLAMYDNFRDESGKISIEKLIQSGSVRIGYSNGRSYTKKIDTLLNKYKGKNNLIERVGSEGPKGLLMMLNKGYIDAMFAQSVEVGFHARNLDLKFKIHQIQISGIKEYTIGYIGCSKTPLGEKIIEKINYLLRESKKRKDFRTFYEYFLNEKSKNRYRYMYNEYFLNDVD